jgi:thiol-disulfide isomerase/thioredoxin
LGLFRPLAFAATLVLAGAAVSCKTSPGTSSEGSGTPSAAEPKPLTKMHFVPASQGDVPGVVLAAVAKEKAEGRRVVVYNGATWCEPCQHFHEAVAAGKLDETFPDVTLLEFDTDRDHERLAAAGYGSTYIPMFALPGKDGRAAGPKAEGGIKGDNVVPYLTKKLEKVLAQGASGT